jgi:hypothetical protein
MFETLIICDGKVNKNPYNDLDSAMDQLFPLLGTSANGYVVDGETGEVLASVSNGIVDYISEETQIHMLETIAMNDPELAMFLNLMLSNVREAVEEERAEEPSPSGIVIPFPMPGFLQ